MARTKRKTNPLVKQEPAQTVPPVKKYKTAAYVRLSVEDSGKPGADTVEAQKALLTGYIEKQEDMELVWVFCDNGQTGTDFSRPAFENMMDAVRKGKIDCLVVKDLSRFGRNYKETGHYLERIFPFLGVRFVAVNDDFDTLTAERNQNGYIVPLKNLINEVYSKDISKKSGSALETKQKNGEFIGAWAPYGYKKDPENKNHLVINEETAATVRQIFQWRAEGISVVQISRRLNDEGILSPSAYLYERGEVKTEKYKGVRWHIQVLKNLLAHPVYLGHMVQGRKKQSFYEGKAQTYTPESQWKVVLNTHAPIIDEETFQKVQAIAQAQKETYHSRLGKFDHLEHSENLLQGLVYCANCNRPLVRYKTVSHGKKLWYIYICPEHSNDPARCDFISIREDVLTGIIMTAVQKQVALAVNLKSILHKRSTEPAYQKGHRETQIKLEAARRTLRRSQSLYESLYQSYVEQLITEQEYMTLKARYQSDAEAAERLIAAIEQEQQESKLYTPQNPFLTEFSAFTGIDTLSREMACALIERIYVDSQKCVDVHFRYRDEFQVLMKEIEGRHGGENSDLSAPISGGR